MEQTTQPSAKFWNKRAESYAKRQIGDVEAYEKKLAYTREHFSADSAVFEFGCGTGSTALLHAPYVEKIVSTDISQKMIDIARRKQEDAGIDNIEFKCTSLSELTYPAESFDVVLGLNVLHLMDDIDAVIRKSYELLKPGGVFVSSSACIGGANVLIRKLLPIGGMLGVIPRVNIFDKSTLDGSMIRAGFSILRSEVLNKNGLTCFVIAQK